MTPRSRAGRRRREAASPPTAASGEAGRPVRRGAGSKADGARFIAQAIAAGAAAIAAIRRRRRALPRAPFVRVANPRRALALAAARFYPRQPATIAAVTGTSGKTSVAAFTRQIWQRSATKPPASAPSAGVAEARGLRLADHAGSDRAASQLDEIAGEGVTHLAFEASSHGLDQHRLDGVRIAAGGFTNLSRATTWIIIRRRALSRRQAAAVPRSLAADGAPR
jgi:UDP-N-acetylmuramoyl-L-alanyl-D-glutamate--2,6-diaminopimelate ligase